MSTRVLRTDRSEPRSDASSPLLSSRGVGAPQEHPEPDGSRMSRRAGRGPRRDPPPCVGRPRRTRGGPPRPHHPAAGREVCRIFATAARGRRAEYDSRPGAFTAVRAGPRPGISRALAHRSGRVPRLSRPSRALMGLRDRHARRHPGPPPAQRTDAPLWDLPPTGIGPSRDGHRRFASGPTMRRARPIVVVSANCTSVILGIQKSVGVPPVSRAAISEYATEVRV